MGGMLKKSAVGIKKGGGKSFESWGFITLQETKRIQLEPLIACSTCV